MLQKNQYPAFFYDSLMMLAHLLNNSLRETLENHESDKLHFVKSLQHNEWFKGSEQMKHITNNSFEGKNVVYKSCKLFLIKNDNI